MIHGVFITTRGALRMQRIEVFIKDGLTDAMGEGIVKDIADLDIASIGAVRTIQVYHVEGTLSTSQLRRIGAELLADPVSQQFVIGDNEGIASRGAWVVDVTYHAGVTDAVGLTAMKGIRDLGIEGARAVHTSWRYILLGRPGAKPAKAEVDAICRRLLANAVIQSCEIRKA